jgi:nucleolar pre-ribosomal-associated protein 1
MAKFDVSPFLDTSLGHLSSSQIDDPKDFALGLKELENLIAIAGYSPGMRWFAASDELSLSPFTLLLKVYVENPQGVALKTIREVLSFVAVEHNLVPANKTHPGLLPLLEALQTVRQSHPGFVAQLWPFLDNCLTRCANAPVKYIEKMYEMLQEATQAAGQDLTDAVTSPIALAMLEQLPFAAAKEGEHPTRKALSRFLPIFFGLSASVGESRVLLELIFSKMVTHLSDSKGKLAKAGVPKNTAFEHNTWPLVNAPSAGVKAPSTAQSAGVGKSEPAMSPDALERTLHMPDGLEADNSALVKWSTKTVDELVDEGYLTSLMALLVSEHASIRKEALVNILKAAAKIQQSEYEEKEQIWLLLSELAETASGNINNGPLPSTIVSFACHALNVLRDPLSNLYPKVNVFLIRAPFWNLDRLPLVDEILSEEPGVGDSFYAQVNWLLGYLLDGLRTPQDLALFHKKRAKGPVFERILVLAANPYMRLPLRSQVLRLLYRATSIEGGSTTLTTRLGIVSWLEARQAGCTDASEAAVLGGLRARIWETCDQDRVRAWSKGGFQG